MGHGGLGFFVNVNCITMRKNPVYVAFLSQFPPSESSKIRGVVRAEPQRAMILSKSSSERFLIFTTK